MGLERQLGLMAPAVHPFNQEHTVSMVKRRHMAADMDLMPHVLAALTVLHQDLELEVLALDRAASGKQDLEQAVLALDKADLAKRVSDKEQASDKVLALGKADLA